MSSRIVNSASQVSAAVEMTEKAQDSFLFTKEGIPYLPEKVSAEMRKYFRTGNWKNFIFRRVSKVNLRREDLERVCFHEDPVTTHDMDIKTYKRSDFSDKEFEKNISLHYRKFSFVTSSASIRDNDYFQHQEIYVTADSFADLDITTLDFEEKTRVSKIPPRVGDLVCMLVRKPSNPRYNPRATKYFNCSEQFMRAWTAVMYDKHPALEKKGKEPQMRDYLMSGNRLNTNSSQKYYYAHKDHGKQVDPIEMKNRFYYLRTEGPSKKFIHAYSDLVLMVRYGVLPCYLNVPANRGEGVYMLHHDTPKGYMCGLLKHCGYDPEKVHNMNWVSMDKMVHRKAPTLPRPVTKTRKQPKFGLEENDFPSLCDIPMKKESPEGETYSISYASLASNPAAPTLETVQPLVPEPSQPKTEKQKKERQTKKEKREVFKPYKVQHIVFNKPLKMTEDGSGMSWAEQTEAELSKTLYLAMDLGEE